MKVGFLIISYTKGNLNNVNTCLTSIRKFYKYEKVVIVDNYTTGNDYTFGNNTVYHKNESNSYELGAICHGIKSHQEIDRWITIHDSCKLIKSIPVDIYEPSDNKLFIPFWCDQRESYSPTMPILIDKLKNVGIKYEDLKNDNWESVCGLMFISDKSVLNDLINLRIDEIRPNKKIEAVMSETLLGLVITHLTGSKLKPLHEGQISIYFSKQKPWTFIEKYASGLGSVPVGHTIISQNSKLHPSKLIGGKTLGSQDECVRMILKEITKDEEMVSELINSGQNDISFDGGFNHKLNIPLIYRWARHQVFTFRYFIDKYNKTYNN